MSSAQEHAAHRQVVTTSSDGVATITLHNPARKNAMNVAGWAALRDALREVAAGQDRVLVLTGAGEISAPALTCPLVAVAGIR